MSHSDRKTEEAEIKHSLFGFCFCSMCRGLKRPEPGSKGENPKLPYDKKSYTFLCWGKVPKPRLARPILDLHVL